MLFKNYTKELEAIKEKQERLETLFHAFNSHFGEVLIKMNEKELKIMGLEEKLSDNMKKVNEMTLELKSVVSQARAALSERKAFEAFVELAESKLLDIVTATKNYCDMKIKKELSETKDLLKNLKSAFEKAEPYARLTQMSNSIERIEEILDKPKRKTTKKTA